MATEITPLEYGRVIGRFTALVADTADDPDVLPDPVALEGSILLTPEQSVFYAVTAKPAPTTLAAENVTVGLDPDGYVVLNDAVGGMLLATNPETGKPLQWTASFANVRLHGSPVGLPDVKFPLLVNGDTDLTLRAAYARYVTNGHAGVTYEEYLDTLDLPVVDPTPLGGFGTTPFGTGPFGGTL